MDFGGHFIILYGVPEAQEASKNLPGARGSVLTQYEPISCHGDHIRPQYYNFSEMCTSQMCTSQLCTSRKSYNIGDEWGRRGTIWGLIFSEDGATGSRKVFRCLLGLWDAI